MNIKMINWMTKKNQEKFPDVQDYMKYMKDTEEVEICNRDYSLAKKILEEHREKGFDYNDKNDIRQYRKVSAIANLLEELDDKQVYELKIDSNNLIKFPKKLVRIK